MATRHTGVLIFAVIDVDPPMAAPRTVTNRACVVRSERVRILGGLVEDTASNWILRLRRAEKQRVRQNLVRGARGAVGPVFFQRAWEPTFGCELEERLGSVGDGGKWVCNPARLKVRGQEKVLVYSVGSRNDFGFEEAVATYFGRDRVEIHTFDPAEPAGVPDFVTYHRVFLSDVDDVAASRLSFASVRGMLGHARTRIDLLKLDVEGSEHAVLSTIDTAGVDQILVEVHLYPLQWPGMTAARVDDMFERLATQGFEIFHKEPNTEFGGGKACEYGLVRVDWDEVCGS